MKPKRRRRPQPRNKHPLDPCSVVGCKNTPSERKPYCIDHLDRLPLTSQLMQEVARRDAEVKRAAAGEWQHIDTNGSVAEEILDLLYAEGTEEGLKTTTILSNIAFDVQGEEERERLVLSYCRALGLRVGLKMDDRGHRLKVVRLPRRGVAS